MEPMTAFLFSMQAAGVVSSIYGARSQQKFIRLGRQLQDEQFKTNLEALRLQTAEESLAEMKVLRKNIGTQIAVQAARGNRGPSSVAGINESSANFNADERTRRINLLTKESELRANNVLSGLHTLQSETRLGQNLTASILNTISTSSLLKPERSKTKTKAKGEKKWINESMFSWGT